MIVPDLNCSLMQVYRSTGVKQNVWVCDILTSILLIISLHLAFPKVIIYSDGKLIQTEIKINCSVQSHLKPTIRWEKNNRSYCTSNSSLCEHKDGCYKHHCWSNITTKGPDVNDNYTCTAENAYGISSASYTVPCIEGKLFWAIAKIMYDCCEAVMASHQSIVWPNF